MANTIGKADHAATAGTTDAGLTTERVKSVAAIIAALYFVLNTILASFGINPLPFTNEEVAAAVSSVGAVAMTIIVWWRQNVMTDAANQGHKLTTAIKNGQVAATQGVSQPPEPGTDPALADDDADVEVDEVTGTPVIHVGA